MTEQLELAAAARGWPTWQPATRAFVVALLLGVDTAAAGWAVWHVATGGQLVLVAGFLNGETLAMLLWLVACLCAVVAGVKGFHVLVIGYEAFTAALAALFLCAFILAACGGVLVTGLFGLLYSGGSYTTLHELDRPTGSQVVIEESGSTSGRTWRFYVGGPFVYDQVPDSSITDAGCALLSDDDRTTPLALDRYALSTDDRGRDVLTFTIDGAPCADRGAGELVLPD